MSLSVKLTQFYFSLHFIVLYVVSVLYLCRQINICRLCRMLQMLREGNKFVLAIREVLIEDSGIFTCRAANPAGVAECSAELFVEGAVGRHLIAVTA